MQHVLMLFLDHRFVPIHDRHQNELPQGSLRRASRTEELNRTRTQSRVHGTGYNRGCRSELRMQWSNPSVGKSHMERPLTSYPSTQDGTDQGQGTTKLQRQMPMRRVCPSCAVAPRDRFLATRCRLIPTRTAS